MLKNVVNVAENVVKYDAKNDCRFGAHFRCQNIDYLMLCAKILLNVVRNVVNVVML